MSDPVFVMGCYNVNPNGKKQLVSDPSQGHAPADCDSCHDDQQWQAIVKVDCREHRGRSQSTKGSGCSRHVTLRGYVRDAELFKDHAGAGLL
jgi:hypothetical protein